MKIFIVRALNFVIRKLFLSHDNRLELKPKAILLALLWLAIIIYSIIELVGKLSVRQIFEYDLMLDIINSQNITNRKIMCPVKRLNDSFNMKKKFTETYYLNIGIFNKHTASYKKQFSSISYSLDLKDEKNNGE
jgi:hypothetical protein